MRPRQEARRPVMLDWSRQRKHRPDYLLLILSVALLIIGLIVVYTISPGLSAQTGVGANYYAGKQIIAIGLGVIAFLVVSQIPFDSWRHFARPMIALAVLAALTVQIFGSRVNGAARWIHIGGLSFQAVELIKFALLIWLAGFLAARIKERALDKFSVTFKPILIALAICSIVVAFFQSDLGSTGVIVAIVGAMGFVAGIPMKRVVLFGGFIAIGTILAISGSAYRRDRLATFLNPGSDCQNTGYQACQALSAVGSGGMFGKGLNRGVFAYGYLPESANDSIFAIFAEMFGFVGVVVLIALFVALFSRIKSVMERAPNSQSRLIVAGILAWLSTQALINIGAMIGLLPLKGITLPLVSYGGTSIIFVMAAIGIVFQISKYTTYSINGMALTEGERYEGFTDGRRNRRPHYAAVSRRS